MSLVQETALIVFARAPQPGRVKSRLATSIGDHAAAEIYARLLGRAIALAADWTGPKFIAAADTAAMTYFERLPEAAGFLVVPQIGDELGARMLAAFERALSDAPAAILMGSDIVDAETSDLLDAVTCLVARDDIVIGPAADGGYWLLGMKSAQPQLFNAMVWGCAEVARLTEARAMGAGLRVHQLPTRHDIDSERDYNNFSSRIARLSPLPLMSANET